MIKKILSLLIAMQSTMFMYGQTGTSSDPYTSLGQAWFAPSDGIYHFSIGGTSFSTYVESGNGWILIASGSSSTSESSYATSTTLTLQSDAILPMAIYTSTLITDVRMNATSGPNIPFDVQSSNATVLGNLQTDQTLSVGTNSSDWTGTGTAKLLRNCAGNNGSLSTHIYHACGYSGNMHWQVGKDNNHEKVAFSSTTKNDLNLWARASSVPLPIELLNFKAEVMNNHQVKLNWQTASELNNDYFTIQRTRDGLDWEDLAIIDGAGNSTTVLNYTSLDLKPYLGISYYRLKQTDFDGHFSYSNLINIKIETTTSLSIFPNPTNGIITITGAGIDICDFKIFNILGQDVTQLTKLNKQSKKAISIDLSGVRKGLYMIKTKTTSNKVNKQ